MTWARGREVIERLLDDGELEVVPADDEHALRIVADAETHLTSAAVVRSSDPVAAISIAYLAAHKAAAATLAAQGLRPTTKGGHVAVEESARAQFDHEYIVAFGSFGRLRRRRHDLTYPRADTLPPDEAEADELIGLARAIVDAVRGLVDSTQLTPYTR
jgi:hypothetical protein